MVGGVGVDLERLAISGVRLALGDVVGLDHRVEHVVTPLQRQVGREERVVLGRRLGQPREQRHLRQVELPDRLVEERLRRAADTDCRLSSHRPVGDVVQVRVEDPRLASLLLQLLGQLGLDDLVLEVVVSGDVGRHVLVVHQLHRQRRGALQRGPVAEDVPDPGAQDSLVVERAVLPEATVLDRDRRALERQRDQVGCDLDVDLIRVDVAERRPVRREDLRERVRVARLELAEVGRGVRDLDDPADGGKGAERHPADREHGEHHDHLADRVPAMAGSALVAFASAHEKGPGGSARTMHPEMGKRF